MIKPVESLDRVPLSLSMGSWTICIDDSDLINLYIASISKHFFNSIVCTTNIIRDCKNKDVRYASPNLLSIPEDYSKQTCDQQYIADQFTK